MALNGCSETLNKSGHVAHFVRWTRYTAFRSPVPEALCFQSVMIEHVKILQHIISHGPISNIDSDSEIDVTIIKELYDEGLLDAGYVNTYDGPIFADVRITMAGRQWLEGRVSVAVETAPVAQEDIVELRPNFFGLGLNLNAAWRKWFGKKT